jgi:L-asparaginase/Glu-tRNA(Gln) amidotransferase subunit D
MPSQPIIDALPGCLAQPGTPDGDGRGRLGQLPPPVPAHRKRPGQGLREAADLPPEANTAAIAKRPRIDYLATGGTIASVRHGDIAGAAPELTAADIAASVVGLHEVADLRISQFLQRPSPSITIGDLLRLRDDMAARVADGSRGLVITQGTDSIEETAFVLDLLCGTTRRWW